MLSTKMNYHELTKPDSVSSGGNPVFYAQAMHPGELARVVGDQNQVEAQRMGGYQGIQRTYRFAVRFKTRALCAITVRRALVERNNVERVKHPAQRRPVGITPRAFFDAIAQFGKGNDTTMSRGFYSLKRSMTA